MGFDTVIGKLFVAGKKDFAHYVRVVSIVFQGLLGTQIIKADGRIAVAVGFDQLETQLHKCGGQLSARPKLIPRCSWEIAEELHQGGLARSYRAGKQDTFFQVQVQALRLLLVLDKIDGKLVNYRMVRIVKTEMFAKPGLSFKLEPL
tara:strand:- start:22030 stop:22470 length:441 start_codon:yes stop_codon:yes gene_type:complete